MIGLPRKFPSVTKVKVDILTLQSNVICKGIFKISPYPFYWCAWYLDKSNQTFKTLLGLSIPKTDNQNEVSPTRSFPYFLPHPASDIPIWLIQVRPTSHLLITDMFASIISNRGFPNQRHQNSRSRTVATRVTSGHFFKSYRLSLYLSSFISDSSAR